MESNYLKKNHQKYYKIHKLYIQNQFSLDEIYNDKGIQNGDVLICKSNVIHLVFICVLTIHSQNIFTFSINNYKMSIYLILDIFEKKSMG